MVKGTGIIPFPVPCVYEVLSNPARKGDWNPQFEKLEEVQVFDDYTRVRSGSGG